MPDIQGRRGLKIAPALHRKVWRLKMCRSRRVRLTWTRQRTAAPFELCSFLSFCQSNSPKRKHGRVQDVAVALDGSSALGIGESRAKSSRKSRALSERVGTSAIGLHSPSVALALPQVFHQEAGVFSFLLCASLPGTPPVPAIETSLEGLQSKTLPEGFTAGAIDSSGILVKDVGKETITLWRSRLRSSLGWSCDLD